MYQNITQQSRTYKSGMDTTTVSSIASSSSFVQERTSRSSRASWCHAYLILAVLGSIVPSISCFTIQTNHPISLSNRISIQSRSAINSTIDRPSSSSNEMSNFEKRMRRLINPKNTATQKKRKSYGKSNVPPNLIKVETLNEYKDMICKNKDRIVVVRFYATWCKVRTSLALYTVDLA